MLVYIKHADRHNEEHYEKEFTTLEELKKFIDEEGDVIISTDRCDGKEGYELTIYDDWIE